jgi:hypothetical protein
MIFVGFDDGAKCIHYYDKSTRRVKRTRNYVFNENEEPRELETTDLPGLQDEGEKLDNLPLQTSTEMDQKPITTPLEPRQLNLQHRTIDFTNPPRGRRAPSRINTLTPSALPDITRSMESSHAKTQEQTHLAIEAIMESIFSDATFFSAREEDSMENPKTIEEALNGEEGDQ